ncbi:hypothetical protein [Flavobacterium sp. JP2137]|uniref:hypothetical protein n=1 Tax=Flavobacterium sp. JP2137 TaxID=3414510 RepID=UPI003D2FC70E
MYNKGPFANWVPKPVMLLLLLLILFPTLSISGVYVSNATDISGALATYTEFVALANNALAIGMGISIPVVLRFKMRFHTKKLVCSSAIILAVLSYMNGTTDHPYVLVAGSFLIGFFKMFLMMEVVLPLMFIITPTGDRGRFYAVFYPISIGFTQFSSYYFAEQIAASNYQSPYLIMSILMLCIALISLVFQHNDRFSFKTPLYQIDWLSMLLIGISAMGFNVFFTFLKQQAWRASNVTTWAFIAGIVFLSLTIYRQKFLKRKLFKFDLFYKRTNVWHGLILLVFMGIFLSTTTLFTNYTIAVLGYNNLINASSNLWMIPGIIAAGIYAFYSFKNNWNIKYYIASGFIAFFVHTLSLYLLIQPQMNIAYLEYALIWKGLGMGILFIGIWFYASVGIAMDDMFGVMSLLLMFRSFLVTAMGTALLSWAVYLGQWQSLADLSLYLDSSALGNGLALYPNLSLQAAMASTKTVLGALCWMIVPILTFVLTHSYGHFNYRRAVLLKRVINGSSIKGYRIKSTKKN